MKKVILFISCMIISSISFANNKIIITCPDANQLSMDFVNQQWSAGKYGYFLDVRTKLLSADQYIRGSMHTNSFDYPQDKNPHLSFSQIKVNDIGERAEWAINCLYAISNPMFHDLDDNNLHMVTEVSDVLYSYKPNESTANTAVFEQKTIRNK